MSLNQCIKTLYTQLFFCECFVIPENALSSLLNPCHPCEISVIPAKAGIQSRSLLQTMLAVILREGAVTRGAPSILAPSRRKTVKRGKKAGYKKLFKATKKFWPCWLLLLQHRTYRRCLLSFF